MQQLRPKKQLLPKMFRLGDRVEYMDGEGGTRLLYVAAVRNDDFIQLAPRAAVGTRGFGNELRELRSLDH